MRRLGSLDCYQQEIGSFERLLPISTQRGFLSLSIVSGGTFFAKKMRDAKYVTMIDPFTQKYGKWGSLQAFPSAISEIFWSASILGALGKALRLNSEEGREC